MKKTERMVAVTGITSEKKTIVKILRTVTAKMTLEGSRELKQHISSLNINSPSLQHNFLGLFVYLHAVAGLVLLSTEFTQPTLN